MRSLKELRDVDDPWWPELEQAIAAAGHAVTVVDANPARRQLTLTQLQVTARSPLGAVALNTGGLLVDHGWLRLLGGGVPPLSLAVANGLEQSSERRPSQLLVAVDVLGGRYAINGGALRASVGEVCYYAPDELTWLPMGMGYGQFVLWTLTDQLDQFNQHLRWPGWQDEVGGLTADQGLAVYPFPFTVEGRNLADVTRQPAPIAELLTLWPHLADQLNPTASDQPTEPGATKP